jgi:large subunit ribosomal protein L7/L12
MSKLDKLVESLSELTVMEAAQLSKKLEDVWGVSAAAPVAAVASSAQAAPAVEQKNTFDVELVSCDDSKRVSVIKEVKTITGLSLVEAKTLVESAPKHVKSGVSKDEAESIKAKLEAAGAKVELR